MLYLLSNFLGLHIPLKFKVSGVLIQLLQIMAEFILVVWLLAKASSSVLHTLILSFTSTVLLWLSTIQHSVKLFPCAYYQHCCIPHWKTYPSITDCLWLPSSSLTITSTSFPLLPCRLLCFSSCCKSLAPLALKFADSWVSVLGHLSHSLLLPTFLVGNFAFLKAIG